MYLYAVLQNTNVLVHVLAYQMKITLTYFVEQMELCNMKHCNPEYSMLVYTSKYFHMEIFPMNISKKNAERNFKRVF